MTILGIRIDNVTMDQAIDTIMESIKRDNSHSCPPLAQQICFVNADCGNIAYRNEEYMQVLRDADLVYADGIGMKIAGKMLRREIRDNVNGTDLFPKLCDAMNGTGKGLYLLGARPGVTDKVCEWIEEHHSDVTVCGHHHGYFTVDEEPEIIRGIARSGASVLLVAFGAPRQDIWISRHINELGVGIAMGVGGLFDFYSGRIPRAPLWMRKIGMEWVYRLIQEPKRMWKRYLIGNGLFIYRVFMEKIRS